MKFEEVVESSERINELKRFASAYVIDFRNLNPDEIRAALLKTGPQYFHSDNVKKAFLSLVLSDDREARTLVPILLKRVLLQKDGFISAVRETEDDVISWEQGIIDASNESKLTAKGKKEENLQLFRFILDIAWEQNDSISSDEKNLIEKIRERLVISEIEYRIFEADLGKFQKPGNEIHTRTEIENARRLLQTSGLVASIKDSDGEDYDVIPEETAAPLRALLGIEVREHGFRELVATKYVRKKSYLLGLLEKCEIPTEGLSTTEQIQADVIEHLKPSIVLGGISQRDGLSMEDLASWCEDLGIPVSGAKLDRIERIISFYDNLRTRKDDLIDERELWYANFELFGKRDLAFLRSQQLIEKDIEVERKFEAATNFAFEKKLGHKQLKMIGTAHPDGVLSNGDSLIFWDNKSKESAVSLKDHIKQFDGYIREADRSLTCFIVIGPEFSEDSQALAMQYKVQNGTAICLITAEELKQLAEKWASQVQSNSASSFPLGYFEQVGRFNPALVPL